MRQLKRIFEKNIPTIAYSIFCVSSTAQLDKIETIIQKNFTEESKPSFREELDVISKIIKDQRTQLEEKSTTGYTRFDRQRRRIHQENSAITKTSQTINGFYLPQEIVQIIFSLVIQSDINDFFTCKLISKDFSQAANPALHTTMKTKIKNVVMPNFEHAFLAGTNNMDGIWFGISFDSKGQIISLDGADNVLQWNENKKEFGAFNQKSEFIPKEFVHKSFHMIYKWDINKEPEGPFKECKDWIKTNNSLANSPFYKNLSKIITEIFNQIAINSYRDLEKKLADANIIAPNFYDVKTYSSSALTLWLAYLLNEQIPIKSTFILQSKKPNLALKIQH